MNPVEMARVLRSGLGLRFDRAIAGVGESGRDWWGQAAFAANRPLRWDCWAAVAAVKAERHPRPTGVG